MVSPGILIGTVAAVGVLHTMVPDHWAPIALLARQNGWARKTAARAAAVAGLGHTISTLAIAAIVWGAGAVLAQRYGTLLDSISGAALVLFGLWILLSSLRELRTEHGHSHFGHYHWHRHGDEPAHRHWHEHHEHDWHAVEGTLALAPQHEHAHASTSRRTALLLILGSSPMIEGIPAFFAAAKFGALQLGIMSAVFAIATIGTYVALVLLSASGLEHISLGRFERYGEVLSGALVALIGGVFFFIH